MNALDLNVWAVFIVVSLASARTFRLLAFDTIAQPIRNVQDTLLFKLSPDSFMDYPPRRKYMEGKYEWQRYRMAAFIKEGLECPWCAGYWYGAAWTITALAWSNTLVWQILAVSFAANYVAAVLNGLYDVVHEEAEDRLND